MRKIITLSLSNEMISEILNHLTDGLEVWRNTERYLASNSIVSPCVIAKCSSVSNAHRMIKLYEETISTIERVIKSEIIKGP